MSDKSSSIDYKPDGDWEFNDEVTQCFEDMLKRSIPQFNEMRNLVFKLGNKYIRPETDIVDLGSSRGGAADPFIKKHGALNQFHLVEKSKPMLEALKDKYGSLVERDIIRIKDLDLRKDYPSVKASLTTSILTFIFIPIEYRQRVIQNIYDSLLDGGALIMVEKVLGNSAELKENFVDLYYDLKEANGYSREKIQKKRESLEGELVPATPNWNEDLLKNAGFTKIDTFWRWCNFAGWIAVK